MKRLLFNRQFINASGDDLVAGKIHTIRQNYEYWKKFEGQNIALCYWSGKPYRSKQIIFCVKKLVSVELAVLYFNYTKNFEKASMKISALKLNADGHKKYVKTDQLFLMVNDGFDSTRKFRDWFWNYHKGEMAILHFTDFQYRYSI
jgi:hypothetical protein